MSEFAEQLKARRSVRQFTDDAVPKGVIESLIEIASHAPNASNRQGWQFGVVLSREIRREMARLVSCKWTKLAEASGSGAVAESLKGYSSNLDWFDAAPVAIVVSCRAPDMFLSEILEDDAEHVAGSRISAAMAAQNLMLAAHDAGLGSCCLTGPVAAEKELKQLLGMGARRQIVCLIALGYPDGPAVAPERKPVEKITKYYE